MGEGGRGFRAILYFHKRDGGIRVSMEYPLL